MTCERLQSLEFQSTPPIRVATWRYWRENQFRRISIHATHTGGDHTATSRWRLCQISIHATHTGGDVLWICLLLVRWYFNPRHPYGWRPDQWEQEKGDKTFQSTPPIRVATAHRQWKRYRLCISIHATHTGGDWAYRYNHARTVISIHATHTGGDISQPADRMRPQISIHATHTGGDIQAGPATPPPLDFNPRHPYGWRHALPTGLVG